MEKIAKNAMNEQHNPIENSKQSTKVKGIKALSLLLLYLLLSLNKADAQSNLFSSVYFQNQYLSNPAMAGLDQGVNINLALREQWTTLPGNPRAQAISADFNAGRNVGLGINVSNDKAGLLGQTRAVITYAYHLQLGMYNNQQLNFGLSAGINDQRINNDQVEGDQGDVQVVRYNQQPSYFDGDFGASYTSNNLTLQYVLPNLNHFFRKSNEILGIDRSVFFASASYKFPLDNLMEGSAIEPKVVFRSIQGYSRIIDAGVNISLNNSILYFYSMYHSSQSESFGFGANVLKNWQLMLFYTNESSAIKTYTNGQFEIGLKLHLFKENNY